MHGAVFEKPDKTVLKVWLVSSSLTYLVLTLIAFAIGVALWLTDDRPLALAIPLAPILLWAVTALTLRKQWENWTFHLTNEALEMSQGWIWRRTRAVARDRVQHVDINSGPLDRRFGLVQVVVYTAGTVVGTIPGLRPERADELRHELMRDRGTP